MRARGLRRVRVLEYNDTGEVIDRGKSFRTNPGIYFLGIPFPETGECLCYDRNCEDVEDKLPDGPEACMEPLAHRQMNAFA
jgi:hypothetical protein